MFLTYRRPEGPIQMLDTAHHLLNGPRSELCDGSIAGRMTMQLRCDKTRLPTSRAIIEDRDAFLRDFQEPNRCGYSSMLEASGDGFSDFVESGGGKGDDAGTRSAQCQTKQPRHLPQGKHLGQAGDEFLRCKDLRPRLQGAFNASKDSASAPASASEPDQRAPTDVL